MWNCLLPAVSTHSEIGNPHRFLLHAVHIHCAFRQTYNWLVADKLVYNRVQLTFDFPILNDALEPIIAIIHDHQTNMNIKYF